MSWSKEKWKDIVSIKNQTRLKCVKNVTQKNSKEYKEIVNCTKIIIIQSKKEN